MDFLSTQMVQFLMYTGFANVTWGHIIMILIGLVFIFLGIRFEFEPLLLVPIGFGMLVGNIPFYPGLKIGIYESGSVLHILYHGVQNGWYPPLIFLGIGAMTDFSALLSNPKLFLIGAAAQTGIFAAYAGADGPTAICLSSQLPHSHLPFFPVGSRPDGCHRCVGLLLHGSRARHPAAHHATHDHPQGAYHPYETSSPGLQAREDFLPHRRLPLLRKISFPIVGFLFCAFIVPSGLPLLGMLFFGNLLKECGVTKRLSEVASNAVVNVCTLLIGITVGASTQATSFLTGRSVLIFCLGAFSFIVATFFGVLFVKIFNLFLKDGNKINPLIGNSGVSAVPDAARVSNNVGLEYDRTNYLLQHAMGPNVAGVVGSAVAAGILLAFLH